MSRWLDAHAAPGRIDLDIAVGDRCERSAAFGPDLPRVTAPQQSPHARHQLANAEGLGQIIVGPAVEAEHLVGLLAPGGQHQDRRFGILRVAPNGAAERHTVQSGQHEIEDHQVEAAVARLLEPDAAVRRFDGRHFLESKVQRDELTDVGLVFDDEH